MPIKQLTAKRKIRVFCQEISNSNHIDVLEMDAPLKLE